MWLDFERQQEMDYFTGGSSIYGLWNHILARNNGLKWKIYWWICLSFCLLKMLTDGWSVVDYLWIIVMFLSAVWTLILTAPIHCRWIDEWSIAEQVMQCYISPNLMKKQTHLHLGWPEGEHIFSYCFFFFFFYHFFKNISIYLDFPFVFTIFPLYSPNIWLFDSLLYCTTTLSIKCLALGIFMLIFNDT